MALQEILAKIGITITSGKKAPKPATPGASKPAIKKSNIGIAFKNFKEDLPHLGEHIQNINSAPRDRQFAFVVMVLGLIVLIAGLVVQFVL